MKKLASLLIIAFMTHAQLAISEEPTVGTLILHVSNLKNDNGEVRIALARSKEELDFKKLPLKLVRAEIRDRKAEWAFVDLPFGEYAIKLYHDENGNEVFDRNFLGIPKEGYGFSNNAKGRFGPPAYDQVKFTFNEFQAEMTIKVIY